VASALGHRQDFGLGSTEKSLNFRHVGHAGAGEGAKEFIGGERFPRQQEPLDLQQRFGAIEAPGIVGSASSWLPMGCAPTLVTMLPDNYHQGAHDAPANPSAAACGPHRSLPVVPLIADKRYYGETPAGLRRDCRPVSGNGPGGWRWVGAKRWPFWGANLGTRGVNRECGNRQRSKAEAQPGVTRYYFKGPRTPQAQSFPSLPRPAFLRSAGVKAIRNSTSAWNVKNQGSANAGILDASGKSTTMTAPRCPLCSVK